MADVAKTESANPSKARGFILVLLRKAPCARCDPTQAGAGLAGIFVSGLSSGS